MQPTRHIELQNYDNLLQVGTELYNKWKAGFDGHTCFIGTEKRDSGYIVGLTNYSVEIPIDIPEECYFIIATATAVDVYHSLRGVMPDTVGYWVEEDAIYLDIGVHYYNLDYAKRIAKTLLNQKAIYCLDTKEVIYV